MNQISFGGGEKDTWQDAKGYIDAGKLILTSLGKMPALSFNLADPVSAKNGIENSDHNTANTGTEGRPTADEVNRSLFQNLGSDEARRAFLNARSNKVYRMGDFAAGQRLILNLDDNFGGSMTLDTRSMNYYLGLCLSLILLKSLAVIISIMCLARCPH